MKAVLVFLAALVLAACTVSGTATPVPHLPVHPPPDRDPRAVLAAVRKLDMCKLVAPVKDMHPAPAQHGCLIFGPGQNRVNVFAIERSYGTESRAGALAIDGVRVYLAHDSAGTYCNADVPVSYTVAIAVYVVPDGPGCVLDRQLVANAVRNLATPDRVTLPDDPVQLWTPCELLGRVVAAQQGGGAPQSTAGAFGDCTRGGQWTLRQEVGAPVSGKPFGRVDGVALYRTDTPDCDLSWLMGAVLMQLTGPDCGVTKQGVGDVLSTLHSPPTDPAPQRPLTYPPDNSDVPAVGDCVDYVVNVDAAPNCQPYQPVAVPKGAQQVTDAMARDPYVRCAVALDGVRQAFPLLHPVVDTGLGSCNFVSAAHDVQLEFLLDPDGGASIGRKVHTSSISGHPAIAWDDGTRYTACLLTDLPSGAQWCVRAQFRAPRDQAVDAPPDTSGVARLPDVLAAAARYL